MPVRADENKLKSFIADRLGLPLQLLQGKEWEKELIEKKIVSEEKLLSLLSEFFGVPYVDLRKVEIPPDVVKIVPRVTAEKQLILPFEKRGPILRLAMADPSDVQTRERIRFTTGFKIQPFVALPFRIKEKLEEVYGKAEEEFFSRLKSEIMKESSSKEETLEEVQISQQVLSLDDLKSLASQTPIVKLVNAVILEALKKGASDIHIEPFEKELRIRYRIDGVLHVVAKYQPDIKDAVVARIKVLSGLDIAEKRLPQDGRMRARFQGRDIDFRVSTVPTVYGEKVVLRILDKGALKLNLEELGFEEREYNLLKKAIHSPYGMVLVTGPTGSGKTTTLYSSLLEVNKPEVNIMTVEDPVEYNLYGINQVQVNPEIGLTFARALRAFLRQDPDIIMVGEIRDTETAEIAVEAALTGHLVLSTLHTNDAPSTVTRLVDMGIEPFLVSSSVILVIAQRLARKICPYCKEEFKYPKEVLEEVGFTPEEIEKIKTYKGKGCEKCDYTGYKGRVALYEVMELVPEIRDAIVKGENADRIREIAKKYGMRTLREIGKIKIAKGVTTPEEVLRVTRSY
ncbi:type IV-A pilus assembly ATPase PilB [Thermovibrio ammonificans HB-1]|jgi:type IV pilus assembly protein PilB|uniref:Type IV-A pilus assembly ATPase PilB n=1 Tax=Thermovibrio ammonificans (strain DSM 15698 / JCM 12110 / HB-1) TaxID=648996 RepID=E8T5K8_THEA1|nr:type IV-A pilus assembly ATPase PilB [Thermovibrio ammonificans]ADU96483.1 type IV-A pilus assembly ATPase PilB [Thermovibrio ammonificans HB-1]